MPPPEPAIHNPEAIIAARGQIVDRFKQIAIDRQGDSTYNPLREMNHCYDALIAAELPAHNFTIGTIDPRSFGHTSDGLPDPLETEYAHLADDMGINPFSNLFQELFNSITTEAQEAWIDWKKPYLTSYDTSAMGTEKTRRQYLDQLEKLGFSDLKLNNAFLCYGGMDGIVRATRSLVGLVYKERGDEIEKIKEVITQALVSALPELPPNELAEISAKLYAALKKQFSIQSTVEHGYPVPGFTMAARAAAGEGATAVYLHMEEKENHSFTFAPDGVEKMIKDHPQMEIMTITPFNNPTSESWNPETLKEFLQQTLKIKEGMRFVFDMAYIELVDSLAAQAIVKAIYESGAIDRSAFIFSRSKAYGQPRLRSGLMYVFDENLREAVYRDTQRSFPSFSWLTDLYDRVLTDYLQQHPEVLPLYRDLLRKRQRTLLGVLERINEKNPIFEDIQEIAIPGIEEDDSTDVMRELQVPLYLFVKFREGYTAWDLAKDYGIIAAPGSIFGGDDSWVRFSVGTLSCSDMEEIASRQ